MKVTWAPWRMDFILGPKGRGCILCRLRRGRDDRKNLILHRGKTHFVLLNKYPYANGHLMIVPNRHVDDLTRLKPAAARELAALLQRGMAALKRAFHPQGFNAGLNQGKAAGAGIAEHLHFHIVPRWIADTNFMPVVGETKVMPQHLLASYDLLKKNWK